MFDPHIYAASRIVQVLRGSPWYDVPAEALDILLNIFQHEGRQLRFSIGDRLSHLNLSEK